MFQPDENDIHYGLEIRKKEGYGDTPRWEDKFRRDLSKEFAQEFAAQLAAGMQGNRTLTSLNICHNEIDEFARQKLQRLIDRNRKQINGEIPSLNRRQTRRRQSSRKQRFKSANSQRRTADAWFKRRMWKHNTKKVDDWMDRRMTLHEEKKKSTTVKGRTNETR